ncbi:MAG: class I SAM-dependent methyltransferase [Candidatus Shapirobacteria bacterium]|nr:class I SAM-dependent methyltransferase [Candidatus Shapirobacteria bacterium]
MQTNYGPNTLPYGTHRLIAEEITKNKKILDIGCNYGYLKNFLDQSNILYGIDKSHEYALKVLNNGYKNYLGVNLNNTRKLNRLFPSESFDILVFADILEHLNFPKKVLKILIKSLKTRGKVIISLPNVAHLSIRINLLLGRFNYTRCGILDNTHMHLYTVSTAKKLIESSGLKINKIKYSSNRFGGLIKLLPFFGSILGYNLIFVCVKNNEKNTN